MPVRAATAGRTRRYAQGSAEHNSTPAAGDLATQIAPAQELAVAGARPLESDETGSTHSITIARADLENDRVLVLGGSPGGLVHDSALEELASELVLLRTKTADGTIEAPAVLTDPSPGQYSNPGLADPTTTRGSNILMAAVFVGFGAGLAAKSSRREPVLVATGAATTESSKRSVCEQNLTLQLREKLCHRP